MKKITQSALNRSDYSWLNKIFGKLKFHRN